MTLELSVFAAARQTTPKNQLRLSCLLSALHGFGVVYLVVVCMLTCILSAYRVVPLHSFKLIAELQHALALAPGAASKQRNPLVIRIEVRAGHGAGKPTTKIIQETSDLMAFAAKCMGAKWMEAKL
jgi:hypothetical protein